MKFLLLLLMSINANYGATNIPVMFNLCGVSDEEILVAESLLSNMSSEKRSLLG